MSCQTTLGTAGAFVCVIQDLREECREKQSLQPGVVEKMLAGDNVGKVALRLFPRLKLLENTHCYICDLHCWLNSLSSLPIMSHPSSGKPRGESEDGFQSASILL